VISTSSIPKQTILCIDNDEVMLRWKRRSGRVWLRSSQRSVTEQALRLVIMRQCDAVLLDYEIPGDERIRSGVRNKAPQVGASRHHGVRQRSNSKEDDHGRRVHT